MADGKDPVLPVVYQIETRDGSLAKDARMVNCYPEKTDEGVALVKRPGTVVGATYIPSGTPQGIGAHNGHVWCVVSDHIYQMDGTSDAAIPSVTTTGQQYQIISDISLGESGMKSQYGAWILSGVSITKVTDVNYPAYTSQGVAWLDGAAYVLEIPTTSGRNVLRGSDLEDPYSWDPLNFIEIPTNIGTGVYVCNYLNYIAVFCEYGLVMYYDAGNPTGSPLLPVSNASWLTGCGSANSVVKVNDDLYFIANSKVSGYSVMVLRGLSLNPVSTPAVDRVLNYYTLVTVSAQAIRISGHQFYIITGTTAGGTAVTLAYDITSNVWTQWTSYVSGAEVGFVGINCLTKGATHYMQDRIAGTALLMTESSYQDDVGTTRGTQPIYTRLVTKPFDWGTLKRKFMTGVYLLADTISTTVSLRYSDSDYASFSSWRTFDMSTVKKFGLRFGSSRRRSWEILHTGNTALKLYGMEVEIDRSSE